MAPQVRVNAIAPGAILWPEQTPDTEAQSDIINSIELKRLSAPADIASAVTYFALDVKYVTDQILAVDGGRTLSP